MGRDDVRDVWDLGMLGTQRMIADGHDVFAIPMRAS